MRRRSDLGSTSGAACFESPTLEAWMRLKNEFKKGLESDLKKIKFEFNSLLAGCQFNGTQ